MTTPWPMLDGCGICPGCRRIMPADKPCDLDGAVIRRIASAEDRQALIDAVWGSQGKRAELMRHVGPRKMTARARVMTALALGGVGAVGAVVAAVLGQTGSAVALVAGLTGAVLGASAKLPGRILIPSGGAVIAPQPRFAAGQILPCEAMVAPGSGIACAAWALELRYDGRWGSRTTLRVGASAGFYIVLDGGEYARIPPGPLWIQGALPQLAELETPSFEELLHTLDPVHATDTDVWPLFRFNIIGEQTLHIGDRIEILGEVERELGAGPQDAMYRDAPASVLVPTAVPALRLVSRR
jgi:hypothetical protein